MPEAMRETFDVEVYAAQTASYKSLHIHDRVFPYWIASHVVRGAVRTETVGLVSEVRPGDVMVHPPNLPFSEEATEPGTHEWIAFALRLSAPPADVLQRFPLPPLVTLGELAPLYSESFRRLEEAFYAEESSTLRPLRVGGSALLVLSLVVEAWQRAGCPPRPPSFGAPDERFADVIAFMAANLAAKQTRETLARRAALHPGSFDRAFRAAHGVAPLQMLRDLRLRRAARLLESTNDTLDAIACAAGLGDAPHLSRVFRARYGVSPGQWRTRAKGTREGYILPFSSPGEEA